MGTAKGELEYFLQTTGLFQHSFIIRSFLQELAGPRGDYGRDV